MLAGTLLGLGVAPAYAAPGPVAPVATLTPSAAPSIESPAGSGAIVAPTPGVRPTPADPSVRINLGGKGDSPLNSPLALVLLLGALSLIPAALIMVTAFTRIVIVLGFTRSALGTNNLPPNQVIIGLAIFLSLFVMGPVLDKANHDAVQPYLHGQITSGQAYTRGLEPFRGFMLHQVRQEDLGLFVKLSGKPRPASPAQVPTTTLIPAFVISELRTSFLIGFVIFVPFIIIDLVVSAALSAMGMVMLPPVLISLPFKLLLFVAADGWHLVVQSLVESFHAS